MACSNYSNGSGTPIVIGGTLDPAFCHTDWSTTFNTFLASMVAALPGNYAGLVVGDSTPGAADQDKLWYRTDSGCKPLGLFIFYNGAWVRAVPHHTPPGSIISYAGEATGFFVLDATDHVKNSKIISFLDVYDQTQNSSVYATNPFWRVCDGTNGTPDLRGRVAVCAGAGTGLTDRKPGVSLGEENHTLQLTEIPTISAPTGSAGTGGIFPGGVSGSPVLINPGGSGSHNNMQPSYVLYSIMRTSRMI